MMKQIIKDGQQVCIDQCSMFKQQDKSIVLDITDDMYRGTLDSEIIDHFICMLCYGIVFKPLKCTKCESLVCNRCVNQTKL